MFEAAKEQGVDSRAHLDADSEALCSVGEYEASFWRARIVTLENPKRSSNETSKVDSERLSEGVETEEGNHRSAMR
jgi:hypothetical protein